jgi:LuxR family maltose regulon positive regulatory protein
VIDLLRYENPYISQDSNYIYIMDTVFKEFLALERIKQGIDTSIIVQRAAKWFSKKDQLQAVLYWHLINKYESILNELENSNSIKMSAFDANMMIQAFNSVGKEKLYDYPIATLKYIFFLVRYGDRYLAKKMISDFKHHFDRNEHPNYERRQLLAELYLICSVVSYNNAKLSVFFSRKAHGLLDGKQSIILNRTYVISFGSPHFSGAHFDKSGKYKEIAELLSSDFHYHTMATNGMAMGSDYLCRAEYLLETGSFDDVERLALQSIFKATPYEQKCITNSAKFMLSRLFIMQGRLSEANDVLDELIALRLSETDPANLDVIENCIGYISLILKKDSHISPWLSDIGALVARTNHQGAPFNLVIFGMLLLHKGEFLRFDALYDIILFKQTLFKNQLCILHCFIQKAIADYNNSGAKTGILSLLKAIKFAEQDELLMPFVEYSTFLQPMLKGTLSQIPSRYRDAILVRAKCYNPKSDILSPREVEVLALIEEGFSYAKISEMLNISIHTVKRHVQNVYAKLGVKNKIAAIKIFKSEP